MSSVQRVIAVAGMVLVASAVLGSITRARYRQWWFFSAYLVAVLVSGTLPLLWPSVFHTPAFWQAKETAYAALRFAMAWEVGVRTMRAFPGALATTRRAVLLVLTVTLAAVATAPAGSNYRTFIGELQPRVLNGSVWMLVAIGAVILYYRVPVEPFHKAVLLSYIPYMLVFTVVMRFLAERGWPHGIAMQYLNQLAYVALVAYWNYAIWRIDPPGAFRARPRRGAPPPAPPAGAA